MFLFQRIEEISFKYNDTKKNIADFLLNEKGHIKKYSMQQIADLTYTSKPTLVRFAQTLGFTGWKDFIEELLSEIHYQETHFSSIDPNLPFQKTDSINEMVSKLKQLQIESIEDTASMLKDDTIAAAGDLLLASRYIVVFGLSPNTLLASLFKRKMESIGILISIPGVDACGTLAHALGVDDCAIIISYSGNNEQREPMRFIHTLQSNGVKMIGITSGGDNYIHKNISCVFNISSRERLFSKISGFSTEESVTFILNVLFSYCFSKNYDTNYEHKRKTSAELEYRRQASLLEMQENT